jgi:hypothetical protein
MIGLCDASLETEPIWEQEQRQDIHDLWYVVKLPAVNMEVFLLPTLPTQGKEYYPKNFGYEK